MIFGGDRAISCRVSICAISIMAAGSSTSSRGWGVGRGRVGLILRDHGRGVGRRNDAYLRDRFAFGHQFDRYIGDGRNRFDEHQRQSRHHDDMRRRYPDDYGRLEPGRLNEASSLRHVIRWRTVLCRRCARRRLARHTGEIGIRAGGNHVASPLPNRVRDERDGPEHSRIAKRRRWPRRNVRYP